MFQPKQLLLTLLPGEGAVPLRYVRLRGKRVLEEGQTTLPNLRPAAARVSFLTRSSFFERAELDLKNPKLLPFQARRQVDAALAFSEPYRLRFAASGSGTLQRVALLAVAEADYAQAQQRLGAHSADCSRMALVESAMAALVAQETPEPAALVWQRGQQLLALLVENGKVWYKLQDRGDSAALGQSTDLDQRLERMRTALRSAAQRLYTEREITLLLALGDLADEPERLRKPESTDAAASEAVEARLARSFSGCEPGSVLRWPEVFGMASLPLAFDLLEPERHQQERAHKAAYALGALLSLAALVPATAAYLNYAQWQQLSKTYLAELAPLQEQAQAMQARLPSQAQLHALELQMQVGLGVADFRIDTLLAWVSQITPPGAIIYQISAYDARPAAPASAQPGVTPAPGGAAAPERSAAGLRIEIEWDLQGDYPQIERLAAQLIHRLGERAQLEGSQLHFDHDDASARQARLQTTLLPKPDSFR